MSEELKPIETPIVGEDKSVEIEKITNDAVIADALALAEESDKALAAAEKKIVSLKREKKGDEFGLDEDRIKEIVDRHLEEKSKPQEDEELKKIQAQRTKNAEIIASLKSKQSLKPAGQESNIDPLKSKEDFAKTLNADQKQVYQRIAERHGISVDRVLELKHQADEQGQTNLIQFIKKNK